MKLQGFGRTGLSLLEVMVATGLLATAFLGLTATFAMAQQAQIATRESQAAHLAAVSKLDEITAWVENNPGEYANLESTWDTATNTASAFHVAMGSIDGQDNASQVGVATNPSDSLRALKPASDNSEFFPIARTALTGDVKDKAGFITVVDRQTKTDPDTGVTSTLLSEVTVYVAWRSKVGNAADPDAGSRVVYTRLIAAP